MRNNTMKKLLVAGVVMTGLVAGSAFADNQLKQINFSQNTSNYYLVSAFNKNAQSNWTSVPSDGSAAAMVLKSNFANSDLATFEIAMESGHPDESHVMHGYSCTLNTTAQYVGLDGKAYIQTGDFGVIQQQQVNGGPLTNVNCTKLQ